MTMKKLFFTLAITSAVVASRAQSEVRTLSITPRVGTIFSNISNESMGLGLPGNLSKGKTKVGLWAGADARYQATATLAFSVGAYYERMGCRYDDTDLTRATAGKHIAFKNNYFHLNYLGMPVMAHLYVAKGLAINVGARVAFLLSNTMHSEETSVTIGEDGSYTYARNVDVLNAENKFVEKTDISVPIGVSYERQNVVLDARYSFGLTNLYKGTLDKKCKNRGVTVSVGYKFDLTNL